MGKHLNNQPAVLAVLLPLVVCFLSARCTSHSGTSKTTVSYEARQPLLNSERIYLKFGSYGIDVLESNDTLRVSNLYSRDEAQKVCRTFAVVNYPNRVDPRFSEEHQRIVGGQSIGAVFKQNGWSIEKQHRYFGAIPVKPDFQRVKGLMGPIAAAELALHVYVLVVKRSGFSFDYATIAEVHHPDYLTVDDLRAIYGKDVAVYATIDDALGPVLDIVYQKMQGD